GDRAVRHREQIAGRGPDILAPHGNLMRARHMAIEDLAGHGHERRMGDPRPVMTLPYLAQLVLADLLQRGGVRGGVALDGDLRGPPAQRVNAPAVARLDSEPRVGRPGRPV